MSESKGKPPRGVFHVDTQTFVFTSPLVSLWSSEFVWRLLSPLCHWGDWKPGLSVNASTLAFSCFVAPPPILPGGLLEVYHRVTLPATIVKTKNILSDPRSPLLFPWEHVSPVGTPFFKAKTISCFQRVLSPRRTVLRAKLQVWMSPPYEDVLQLMSHEGRPDRIHIGGDGLNKSRLPGFLLRDFKRQQFISPAHPSSILPVSKFISVLSLPLSTFI